MLIRTQHIHGHYKDNMELVSDEINRLCIIRRGLGYFKNKWTETSIKYIYIGYLHIGSGYYGYISIGNNDNKCLVMKKLFLWSLGTEKIVIYIMVYIPWYQVLSVYKRKKHILLLYMQMEDQLFIHIWWCGFGLVIFEKLL